MGLFPAVNFVQSLKSAGPQSKVACAFADALELCQYQFSAGIGPLELRASSDAVVNA